MKPYLSILLVAGIVSCSPDSVIYENPADENLPVTVKSEAAVQGADYNSAGLLYKTLRSGLYESNDLSFQAIEDYALQNTLFAQLYAGDYHFVPASVIETVMADAVSDLNAFPALLNLSVKGQEALLQLITGLEKIKAVQGTRNDVTTYLGQVETVLGTHPDLTVSDRQVLLTTAGLLRHNYAADCDEEDEDEQEQECDHGDDKDWELSIGHIAATAYGSSLSPGNAVTCSLYGYYNH